MGYDYPHMPCQSYRDAISARLDGEDTGISAELLVRHIAGCPRCRAFEDQSALQHRRVTVRTADPVPDLTAAIVANAVPLGRSAAGRGAAAQQVPGGHWSRWALLAVALTQLVVAVPPMLLGHDSGAPVHLARELGAWDVALGFALLLVVARPDRARGMVPFAGALALAMAAAAAVDLVAGRAGVLGESQHVLELAGLGLLWLTARRGHDDPPLFEGLRRSRSAFAA